MKSRECLVVNYGMGNLWSVQSAVQHLGIRCRTTRDPNEILSASHLILPGVGSFRLAMTRLEQHGLAEAIREYVRLGRGRLLGICLGMQLLAAEGTEDGRTDGLGLLPQTVRLLKSGPGSNLKLPHVGFNTVTFSESRGLFSHIGQDSSFYFVHSYALEHVPINGTVGLTTYGKTFLAAVQFENVMGTQFHPEKSQSNGLKLLRNFLLMS